MASPSSAGGLTHAEVHAGRQQTTVLVGRSTAAGAGGVDVGGTACSTAERLELIRDRRPDLVLVDLEIGQECGFDLARRIDELATDERPEVIMMSARSPGLPGAGDAQLGARLDLTGSRHPVTVQKRINR